MLLAVDRRALESKKRKKDVDRLLKEARRRGMGRASTPVKDSAGTTSRSRA